MEEMAKKRKKAKSNKGKIIAAAVTILAVLNLLVLFVYPELPAKLMGKSGEESLEISEEDGQGSGKAALTLKEAERTFDGNGIFNPLEGVQALDTDGKDITSKVAAAYVPGKSIQEKEIRYTVYTSESEKLEAICKLQLENYQGPSIEIGDVGTISWEQLQRLTEVLVNRGVLKGDDGFGNDVSGGVTYFYEVNDDLQTVDVTFSLTNIFQDYRNEKVIIQVDDLAENMERDTFE